MARVRFHLVTALRSSDLVECRSGNATSSLDGRAACISVLGWLVMLLAVCYPTLLAAMRSETQGRCTLWLKRLAAGQR